MSSPKRNDEFYLDFIVFLVEDELFKVPAKYFKENSVLFSTMLSLPQTSNSTEGDSDEKPIELKGIQKAKFTCLLKAIFHFGPEPPINLDEESWLSVLELANMWGLKQAREVAVQNLQALNNGKLKETEWVLRGRQYMVPAWILTGYVRLGLREEGISVGEAEELGIDSALKVADMHGRVTERDAQSFRLSPRTRLVESVKKDMESVFEKELKQFDYYSADS